MSEKVEAKSAPKPCGARRPALLEGGVAEAVIGGALVGVLEDVVGLVDLLEAMLAVLVAGIAVGMPLHRELAERGLQLRLARGALDSQDLVVAALCHPSLPPRAASRLRPAIVKVQPHAHTPGRGPGVTIWLSGSMRRLGRRSSRLLVLLVVVDLGELRVDDVVLLAPAVAARRRHQDRRRRPDRPDLPAPACTSPRRASSRPAPAHWSWP